MGKKSTVPNTKSRGVGLFRVYKHIDDLRPLIKIYTELSKYFKIFFKLTETKNLGEFLNTKSEV